MTDYQFLLKLKNQSVNPEYTTGVEATPAKNTQSQNIQMVSKEAVDTDMTDKVIKTSNPQPTQAKENIQPKEKSWWESTCTWIEQGLKAGVIIANEYMDIQAIHDCVKEWELDDDNKEYAADMSASSEDIENKKRAAEYASKIENGKRQLEVAHRHIHNCDEHVRCGYAEQYHKMKRENQAAIAGEVVKCAEKVETAKKVVDNIPNCDKEVQADVVACSAQGTVENKNFTREQKGQVGKNIAVVIPKLDESAQAQSFTSLAETMHDYEEVVTEVGHQVANNVSETVKNDTIKYLSNSKYENLQATFTKENIEKIAIEYKKSLGIEAKVSEKEIAQIAKEVKVGNLFQVKQAVKQVVAEEAKTVSNPFVTVKTQANTNTVEAKKEQEVVAKVLNNVVVEAQNFTTVQAIKQELKNCKSVVELANIIKDCPIKVAKSLFKNVSTEHAQELFKHSQNSLFMQKFLLKNNFVSYADVKDNCHPTIKKALNVYTDIDKYNAIIEEQGESVAVEMRIEQEVAQAILKI